METTVSLIMSLLTTGTPKGPQELESLDMKTVTIRKI
jgi:hypothetical protein